MRFPLLRERATYAGPYDLRNGVSLKTGEGANAHRVDLTSDSGQRREVFLGKRHGNDRGDPRAGEPGGGDAVSFGLPVESWFRENGNHWKRVATVPVEAGFEAQRAVGECVALEENRAPDLFGVGAGGRSQRHAGQAVVVVDHACDFPDRTVVRGGLLQESVLDLRKGRKQSGGHGGLRLVAIYRREGTSS